MIGARKGSPLAIGYGDGEMYLGSDAIALGPFTDTISYLEDGDWVVLTRDGATDLRRAATPSSSARSIKHTAVDARWSTRRIIATSWPRKSTSSRKWSATRWRAMSTWRPSGWRCRSSCRSISRISSASRSSACGTASYAGYVGKYWLERFARLPVEIDVASEFRYREAPLRKGDLAIFISQSGETADTLAALRYAKEQGAAHGLGRQRADLDDRARERDRAADAGRPGNRRRLDQGLHLPA